MVEHRKRKRRSPEKNNKKQYISIQCSVRRAKKYNVLMMQCDTKQYNAMQYKLSATQYNTVQYNTMQYSTSSIQCNTTRYDTCNTARNNTINTAKYRTVQHSILLLHRDNININSLLNKHNKFSLMSKGLINFM